MKELHQWTDCLADNHGKRPRLNPGTGKGISLVKAQALASASTVSPHYGFLFTKDDPYVGLDIDVDPSGEKANATKEIPPLLLYHLQANPTTVHYSPSGHGIHIIFKISDPEKLEGMKQGACSTAKGAMFDGDWRWDKSFLTFTENLHPLNAKMATIDYDTLAQFIGDVNASTDNTLDNSSSNTDDNGSASVVSISTGLTMQAHIPSIEELTSTLQNVPATFNHLAQRSCKTLLHSKPQSSYDYWLLVGQACAHTAITLESFGTEAMEAVEAEFVLWSSLDSTSFISIDDVQKKFRSLVRSTRTKMIAEPHTTATFKVLSSLARGATISFPDLCGKDLKPDMNSLKNVEYLMKHEGLTMWVDTMSGGYAVKGPEATIAQWFRPFKTPNATKREGVSQVLEPGNIDIGFLPFFQNKYKQSMGLTQSKTLCRHLMVNVKPTNAFKDWIDSKPWDGVPRFKSVCESITFSDTGHEAQYRSYIEKALLSMIGIHYWPEDRPKIPAILILTGSQHTYKSSWAEWLIPSELGQYLGMGSTEMMIAGGAERDRLLSTRAIIVINECEPLFSPRNEQKIKSSVDQETVTYRDLYASSPVSRQRTALLIGTTNKSDLFTGTLGTRKMWQIPVALCDSYLIKDMDKQQLYAEIKATLAKRKAECPKELIQMAWRQSYDEIEQVEESNRLAKGTMGLDSLMLEVFGDPLDTVFSPNDYVGKRGFSVRLGDANNLDNRPNAWNLTNLLRFMKDKFPDDFIERKQLYYAAQRYSEIFTGSKNKTIDPFRVKVDRSISRGLVTISSTQKVFLFPPIGSTPFAEEDEELK